MLLNSFIRCQKGLLINLLLVKIRYLILLNIVMIHDLGRTQTCDKSNTRRVVLSLSEQNNNRQRLTLTSALSGSYGEAILLE